MDTGQEEYRLLVEKLEEQQRRSRSKVPSSVPSPSEVEEGFAEFHRLLDELLRDQSEHKLQKRGTRG